MKNRYYYGIVLFFISFLTYLATLCRTVYWGDSGEFITAAYTLGITHPTGYPTYTMLGHLFTYLPLSSVAFRVNLMSAFFAALTIVMIFFVINIITKNKQASFISALILAFSYTFWSQAVIAEVHTLSTFLVSLNFYLLFLWRRSQKNWHIYLFGFSYGLTITNHLTTILLAPAFLYFIIFRKHYSLLNFEFRINLRLLFLTFVSFLAGLLPYLYLPIRSVMNPIWDWGNISSLPDLFRHIIGSEYTSGNAFISSDYFSYNLGNLVASFFNSPWGALFFLIPLISFYLLWNKTKNKAFPIFLLISIIPLLIFALNYNTDSGAFFLPVIIVSILLTGILLTFSGKWVKYSLTILIIILFAFNFVQNDLSEDYSAEYYWRNIFESAEPGSLIIGESTHDAFISLYFHQVEKQYLDISVAESFLMTKEWGIDYLNKHENVLISKDYMFFPDEEAAFIAKSAKVNELIQNNIQKRAVYTTFENFSTEYVLNPHGHLFKISTKEETLASPLLFEYNANIRDPNGKLFVSRVLIAHAVKEIRQKEYDSAIKKLQIAIELHPDFEGWNDLAIAYYETGQKRKALQAWKESLKYKDDPQVKQNIVILDNIG